MPDPGIPSGGQYNYPPGPPPSQEPQMHPIRQGSIPPLNTNFIRTDDAYGMPHGAAQSAILPPRSGTALPYPGHPGSSNSLVPGNQGPLRPSSAAGYGPSPRPISGAHLANRPFSIATGGPGMIPPAGTYPAGPARTNTGMSLNNPGPGPSRRPSGSQGPGRLPYPGSQGYPLNSRPSDQYGAGPGPGSGPGSGPGPDSKHRPTPVDIGFEAPIPKPPRSPALRPPKSPAPPMGTMLSGYSGRLPVANGPPTPMSPGPNGKPVGLPSSPSPKAGAWPTPAPAPAPTQSHLPQHAAPEPAPTPKPAAAPAKPPGKGPKTFEEMGVPQQQKEQDCVCTPFLT